MIPFLLDFENNGDDRGQNIIEHAVQQSMSRFSLYCAYCVPLFLRSFWRHFVIDFPIFTTIHVFFKWLYNATLNKIV